MASGTGLFRKSRRISPSRALADERMGEDARRVRTLEERYSNLQRRFQVTEQNMLENNRRLVAEIKDIDAELRDAKVEIIEIKDKMKLIIREIQDTASKEDLTVLKKYIDYWEPLNFVTQNQVDKIVKQAITESGNSNL